MGHYWQESNTTPFKGLIPSHPYPASFLCVTSMVQNYEAIFPGISYEIYTESSPTAYCGAALEQRKFNKPTSSLCHQKKSSNFNHPAICGKMAIKSTPVWIIKTWLTKPSWQRNEKSAFWRPSFQLFSSPFLSAKMWV